MSAQDDDVLFGAQTMGEPELPEREYYGDDIAPGEKVSDGLRCTVCGVALEYRGRGRKPTKCEEHKKGKNTSDGTPLAGPRRTKLDKVERDLAKRLEELGQALAFVEEFDGLTIAVEAPGIAKGLRGIAETDPRFAKILENMLAGTAVGAALSVIAAVAVPIMAHHGMLGRGKIVEDPRSGQTVRVPGMAQVVENAQYIKINAYKDRIGRAA